MTSRQIEVQRRYPVYPKNGMMPNVPLYSAAFVSPNVKELRKHLNRYYDCSALEADMMLHFFEGETVFIEHTSFLDGREQYTIMSDYGTGTGSSLKECMDNWKNIDDQCDDTEFARRSRALAKPSRSVEGHHLPQLRSLQRYPR